RELFEMNLGCFGEGCGNLFFGPEVMRWGRGICMSVAFIHFGCDGELLLGGLAQSLRFVEKNDGAKRTFGQFEKRSCAWFSRWSKRRGGLPIRGVIDDCSFGRRYGPFR